MQVLQTERFSSLVLCPPKGDKPTPEARRTNGLRYHAGVTAVGDDAAPFEEGLVKVAVPKFVTLSSFWNVLSRSIRQVRGNYDKATCFAEPITRS